jgi:DNA-binding response OmpR family regulator
MNQARKGIRGAASPLRILIVEDESDLSLLLSYNLEAEGYVVENVERGDEAELRLAENAPDLVILDWMLPGVSGLEICRRLRARESTRTLPVIMVTARGEEAERVRGLSVGADDYVVKPFSVPEFMARARALLRRRRPERVAAPAVQRWVAEHLHHARSTLARWTAAYNQKRPHSALGYLTPAEFAGAFTATGDRLRNPEPAAPIARCSTRAHAPSSTRDSSPDWMNAGGHSTPKANARSTPR